MRCIPVEACVTLIMVTLLGCSASGPVAAKSTSPAVAELPPASRDVDRLLSDDEPYLDPNRPITLRQSLALALLRNPELEAFSWQLRAQEANTLQESLRPNPILGAKVENFGGTDPMGGFEGAMTTFSISQLIELGDKRMKRTRLAEADHALSAWDYEAKRLEIVTEVALRYIEVLADQHRVELAEQTLELSRQLRAIVKDRARVGVIPTVEVDKALVRVSTEQILLHKARYDLMKAKSQQKDVEVKVRTLLIANHKKLAGAHYEVVTLRDTTIPAARSAYDAARKAFEKGLTNFIDVLDADRTLVNSQRQYIESLSAYHKTLTTLEGLVGQSPAAMHD